jgi:hypothetical protein
MSHHSSDSRDLNLVRMILNLDDNNHDDYQKVSEIYDTYANLKALKFNPAFRQSLLESKSYLNKKFDLKSSLLALTPEDPNSFLLLPVLGKGHLWSTLIRRNPEGFSTLMINKGSSYFHDPIEEFVFKEKNISSLIQSIQYVSPSKENDIEDVYRTFKNNSDDAYNLKIHCGYQKVGNCFTKNIQAGIKIAHGTRNMTFKELKQFRMDSYTPFGTNRDRKKVFKWEGMTTEEMQKKFAEQIALKNPHIRSDIKKSFEIYSSNKRFRQCLKEGVPPLDSLFLAFDSFPSAKHANSVQRIPILLKKLTLYNFETYNKKIESIVDSSNDKNLHQSFEMTKKLWTISQYFSDNSSFIRYVKANHDPLKSLVAIFYDDVFQKSKSKTKIKRLLNRLSPEAITTCKSAILQLIKKNFPAIDPSLEFKSLLKNAQKQEEKLLQTLNDIEYSIHIPRKNFPDVVDRLHESVNDMTMGKSRSSLERGLGM